MHLPKFLFALAIAAFSLAPALAAGPTPVGIWQSTTGESRYEVTLCGDGSQLCARLVWLRADARTPENLQYLNKTVVRGAVATAPNTWKGAVSYSGETLRGSLKLVSANQLQLNGCKAIFCQSLSFVRL